MLLSETEPIPACQTSSFFQGLPFWGNVCSVIPTCQTLLPPSGIIPFPETTTETLTCALWSLVVKLRHSFGGLPPPRRGEAKCAFNELPKHAGCRTSSPPTLDLCAEMTRGVTKRRGQGIKLGSVGGRKPSSAVWTHGRPRLVTRLKNSTTTTTVYPSSLKGLLLLWLLLTSLLLLLVLLCFILSFFASLQWGTIDAEIRSRPHTSRLYETQSHQSQNIVSHASSTGRIFFFLISAFPFHPTSFSFPKNLRSKVSCVKNCE